MFYKIKIQQEQSYHRYDEDQHSVLHLRIVTLNIKLLPVNHNSSMTMIHYKTEFEIHNNQK